MICEGDGYGGSGYYYEPENYNSVIIWLHGKGDNARSYVDLINIAQNYPELKKTKIILPSASIIRFKNFGILDSGWFDMEDFRPNALEDINDINDVVLRISKIICSEINKGIDSSRISLGGFSQGSAMAFLISMTSKKFTIGSCVVVGGWLPVIERGFKEGKNSEFSSEYTSFEIKDCVKEKVDFLVLHGEDDPIVLYQWSLMSKEFIMKNIKPKRFTYKSYPGVTHTISDSMLIDIFSFFSRKMS